jgi:hypothetical protein
MKSNIMTWTREHENRVWTIMNVHKFAWIFDKSSILVFKVVLYNKHYSHIYTKYDYNVIYIQLEISGTITPGAGPGIEYPILWVTLIGVIPDRISGRQFLSKCC